MCSAGGDALALQLLAWGVPVQCDKAAKETYETYDRAKETYETYHRAKETYDTAKRDLRLGSYCAMCPLTIDCVLLL